MVEDYLPRIFFGAIHSCFPIKRFQYPGIEIGLGAICKVADIWLREWQLSVF